MHKSSTSIVPYLYLTSSPLQLTSILILPSRSTNQWSLKGAFRRLTPHMSTNLLPLPNRPPPILIRRHIRIDLAVRRKLLQVLQFYHVESA